MFIFWLLFITLVIFFLALDLGVFHKDDRVIGVGEALRWTGFWIALSLAFDVAVYFLYENGLMQGPFGPVSGISAATDFLTGYLIEKSLSLDNVFVMASIFTYFQIPRKFQHRVLFWGVLCAIVLRAAFIWGGASLLVHFEWVMYVFGAFLVFSGIKIFVEKETDADMGENKVVRLVRRVFPMTKKIDGHSFWVRENGKKYATPLLLSLVVVEVMDAVFAFDSIPAILSITTDTFIVFTSNIMAVLGLRSLYFALAAMIEKFGKLNLAIGFILVFVGMKMLVDEYYHVSSVQSLVIIVLALLAGVLLSISPRKRKE